jgi:hypothetical protein
MSDLLLAMVKQAEAAAKARMQHLQSEYLAAEAKRLADYADSEDTRRQLAKYGVKL